MNDAIHRIVDKWALTLVPAIELVAPQHNAILPSEMLLFCSLALEAGCRRVIESGRKHGYSTEVLCRVATWPVYSIDKHSVREADARLRRKFGARLHFHVGNGYSFVPKALARDDTTTAVLLDGPKNDDGLRLYEKIKGRAAVVGVHDLCLRLGDGPNPGREMAERLGAILSDDPAYLQKWGNIDAAMLKFGHYKDHSELLGEANVLGVFVA